MGKVYVLAAVLTVEVCKAAKECRLVVGADGTLVMAS